MADEIIIKLRAQELCREYMANKCNVIERNEKIISILMKEFGINEDYATKCFMHNKEM